MEKSGQAVAAARKARGNSVARSAESRRMSGLSKIPTAQRRDRAVKELIRKAK